MEKFDAHAAFEAEFGSLNGDDLKKDKDIDLAMFLLSETSVIMIKALDISKRQNEIKAMLEEAKKKGEEPDDAITTEFVENAHENAHLLGALGAYKKIAEKFLK